MESLYERIKPEVIEAIEKDSKEFPSLTASLLDHMKSTVFVDEMQVGQATRLYKYAYGIFESFDLFKLQKLFTPNY